MKPFVRLFTAVMIALLVGGSLFWSGKGASPAPDNRSPEGDASTRARFAGAEGPGRKKTIIVNFTHYKWWLITYQTNRVRCQVISDHDGLPSSEEILYHCGEEIYTSWANTRPCSQGDRIENPNKCGGMYLYLAAKSPGSKEVEIELPQAKAWVSLDGCNAQPDQKACSTLPNIILVGEEPLPNEAIISLQGTINGIPFHCPGSACAIPMSPTGSQGQLMEFWANSSYGDSSRRYTALVRAMPWGDFMAPEGAADTQPQWYADMISSQRQGTRPVSCSDTWQVFPDVSGPQPWLTSPSDAAGLESSLSLYYLASMLIRNGLVNVSGCPDGGLESENAASVCGLEAALPAVTEWQNRFNQEIMQVSLDTGVPAQLMKNVFSRESQFWPGIYRDNLEAGLGQMTENGADTVLLWNPEFYQQFCPLVLHNSRCSQGFGNLSAEEQNLLRGALVSKVNATCIDCPVGINLSQANYSVNVFAESLLGNCEQVGQIITNLTGRMPGEVATYEDLWRFTLVNYNAGAGCLARAIQKVASAGLPLTWQNMKTQLEPACQPAEGYVEDIASAPYPTLTPTSWIYPPTETPTPLPATATPIPSPTPELPTATPAPTFTPSPTATPEE